MTDLTAEAASSENIRTVQNAKGELEIQLSKDLTGLNSVNTTNLTVTGETKLGDNFTVNNTGAHYDGDITEGTHVTNKEYVDNSVTELGNKPLTFAANEGSVDKKLGETVTIKGAGVKADDQYSAENIKTTIDADGNLIVALDKDFKTETVTTNEITLAGKDGLNGTDGISLTAKDGAPGLNGADGTTSTRIVYEKADGTTEEVATLNDGLQFVGNDGQIINKKLNEKLGVVGGMTDLTAEAASSENIRTVQNAKGELEIQLSKDLTGLNSVTTNNLTVLNETKLGDNFTVNNAGAHYDGPITAGDHIVNKSYVDGAVTGVTNNPLTFAANTGKVDKKLGETVTIKGAGVKADDQYSAENIKTTIDADGNLIVALDKDLKADSLVLNGKDGKDGISLTGKDGAPGLNGADGTTSTRIVYEKPDGTTEEVATLNDGLKFKGNQGDSIAKKLNQELEIVGGLTADEADAANSDNIRTVSKDGKLEIQLSRNLINLQTVSIGDVYINGNNNTMIGLSNRDLSAADFATQGRAATEEQLKEVIDQIAGNPTAPIDVDGMVKYDRNSDGSVNKDSVTLEGKPVTASKDANGNISTEGGTSLNNVASAGDYTDVKNAGNGVNAGDLNNAVNDAVNKAGDNLASIVGGNTTVNPDGSVTNNNIGNTGKDNIHDAIDAVNKAATDAKSTVSAGDNVTVKVTDIPGGGKNYEVATKQDVNFDSVTSGKVNVGTVTIDDQGIHAGDKKITGVANGDVSAASQDAVNGSQLNETNQNIANSLGGGSKYENNKWTGPTYNVAGGKYDNVGDALGAIDTKVDNLGDRMEQVFQQTNQNIKNVEKRANAGIAAAMALESAPFVAGKWSYAAAAAHHGGENAVGVTLRKTADNGRWSLTGGVAAASEGDPSFRIGISGVID
uniref:YadA-like family protein n=1 Tax=Acinetobacter pullicarnis TaxID=2576829 RepID=UPI0038994178